jgi:hypothetical protein
VSNNYPDSLLIQQYFEGKLDPEMMHQLEKQALEDQFLWDAMEGYTNISNPGADLSILQRQLHERIVHLQENKKVFDLTWQRLSIAAAAAVLFISAGILFWMNSNQRAEKLDSSSKQVNVTLMDTDSIVPIVKPAESAVKESVVQPVTGWDIYRKYLEENIRVPENEPKLSGSVYLSFEINSEGRPMNFNILNSLSNSYDAEAIRLVREGPDWKSTSGSTIKTRRIEVKFKF